MKAKDSDRCPKSKGGANDVSDTSRQGRRARARALRRVCALLFVACLVFLFQGFASLQRCGHCSASAIVVCKTLVTSLTVGSVESGQKSSLRSEDPGKIENGKDSSEGTGFGEGWNPRKKSEVAARNGDMSGTERFSGTERVSGTERFSEADRVSETKVVNNNETLRGTAKSASWGPKTRARGKERLAAEASGIGARKDRTAEGVVSKQGTVADKQGDNGAEIRAGTGKVPAEAEADAKTGTETKWQNLSLRNQQLNSLIHSAGTRGLGIEQTKEVVDLREAARISLRDPSQQENNASIRSGALVAGKRRNENPAEEGRHDEATGLRGQTRPRSTLLQTNSSLPTPANNTVALDALKTQLRPVSKAKGSEYSTSLESRKHTAELNLTSTLNTNEAATSVPGRDSSSAQNAGAEKGRSRRFSGGAIKQLSSKTPSRLPLATSVNGLSDGFNESGIDSNRLNPRLFRGGVNGLSGKRLVAGVNGLSREVSDPWVLRPSKIAFMFLANGSIHTDRVWDRFFRGAPSKDHYSSYIHSNLGPGFEYNNRSTNASCFYGRTLSSSAPSLRFHISMVDAHKKLLRSGLKDASNQWFVLLSDSCVPLHSFAFTYRYLFAGTKSFVDSRYLPPELDRNLPRWTDLLRPEVSRANYRKGSQWMAVTRKHASMIAYDERFYDAFARKPWNCQDEHYVSTMLPLLDAHGIEERTLTYVDWKNDGCPDNCGSPRPYSANMTSRELLHNISGASSSPRPLHYFWNEPEPCFLNGQPAPCYLFARKFAQDSVDKLLQLLPVDDKGAEEEGAREKGKG